MHPCRGGGGVNVVNSGLNGHTGRVLVILTQSCSLPVKIPDCLLIRKYSKSTQQPSCDDSWRSRRGMIADTHTSPVQQSNNIEAGVHIHIDPTHRMSPAQSPKRSTRRRAAPSHRRTDGTINYNIRCRPRHPRGCGGPADRWRNSLAPKRKTDTNVSGQELRAAPGTPAASGGGQTQTCYAMACKAGGGWLLCCCSSTCPCTISHSPVARGG